MQRTVVAMFDSVAEAEAAAQRLTGEGFDPSDIEIRHTGTTNAGEAEASGERGGFWAWLFGESDDRTSYSERVGQGGALLALTTEDVNVEGARRILGSAGAELRPESGGRRDEASVGRSHESRPAATEEGERVVPVVEEQLRVGKRPVSRGGVRVYSRVTERPVEEQVHLRDERIHVDRRPVDWPVTGMPAHAFEEVVIEATEMEEEPDIAKEARVVEEVVVSKDVTERTEDVSDRVRRTDVEVERIGADADPRDRFASELAGDTSLAGRSWSDVEPEARRRWEARNEGPWARVSSGIREAWERARGRRAA